MIQKSLQFKLKLKFEIFEKHFFNAKTKKRSGYVTTVWLANRFDLRTYLGIIKLKGFSGITTIDIVIRKNKECECHKLTPTNVLFKKIYANRSFHFRKGVALDDFYV